MGSNDIWVRYAKQLISLADEKNIDLSEINSDDEKEVGLLQAKFDEFAKFPDKTFLSVLLEAQKRVKKR